VPAFRDTPAARLDNANVDVLVVGAGITGACVALEASVRGLRVALIDHADYGGGATANCLRIVHGGLRYLQHLDLARARESIRERRMWLRSAPHLVEPLPTVVPTMRGVFPPRSLFAAALAGNDLLSFDRNAGVNIDRRLTGFRVLSREETRAQVPELDHPAVTGGVLFHDAVMYSPERLTLEVIDAARAAGTIAANHTAIESTRRGPAGFTIALRDALTGDRFEVQCKQVVNATGASVHAVAAVLTGTKKREAIGYSFALNLVTSRQWTGPAFAVAGGAGDPDRVVDAARRLFVVPWRGQQLVGTAHFPMTGTVAPSTLPDEFVDAFLQELATGSPRIHLTSDDVRVVQWGLLPVVGADASRVRLLKRHQITDHSADGAPGAFSVVSIKFTNARRVATDVVDRLTSRRSGFGGVLPLPGRVAEPIASFVDGARRQHPALPPDVVEHLVRSYGIRFERVIDLAHRMPGGFERIVPGAPVISAQLGYGAAEEDGRTEDDLLWRRTELGARGLITDAARQHARSAIRFAGRHQVRSS
jgi:glycerol-3-phosphate dehydrogenase